MKVPTSTPTPRSAATQAPPLLSEHGAGQMSAPKTRTVKVKPHTRQVKVPAAKAAASDAVDPITAQINAAQLPQLQAIKAAQAASETAAKNAAMTTQGYYSALANVLKGAAPATQGAYQSAAADTSAFGKGFSDGQQHVQSQITNDAAHSADISGGAAPGPTSTAGADALYALGGYIPASTMEREGAAFSSAAAQLPGSAMGQGAAAIGKIAGDQRTDQQALSAKLDDLAAQVPGLRLQYKTQADNLAAKNAATAAHSADVLRQQKMTYLLATGYDSKGNMLPGTRAKLASALGYDPVTGKATASTSIKLANAKVTAANAAARLDLATQKTLSDLYGVDANGNMTLAGRRAALAQWKATHPPGKGGMTATLKVKLQEKAAQLADLYFWGKPNKVNGQDVMGTGIAPIADYQEALKLALSHGIPLAYAQKALNALYPIGQNGRPWVSAQARLALEKAGGPLKDPMSKPTEEQAAWMRAHGFPYNGDLAPHGDTGFRDGKIPK